jgi:hypothetical protein
MAFSDFILNSALTARSLVKILLQSRSTTIKPEKQSLPLVVMGNGPSLNDAIKNSADKLTQYPLLAVNYAGNTPQFTELKPEYYILVDPFFFGDSGAENLNNLWHNLSSVDWKMTLIVPRNFKNSVPAAVIANANITVQTINCVGVEGFAGFEKFAFKHHMAMPRPRNVLIPAIMAGIWLGFEEIYIVGADHSWMQSIWVDEENTVVTVQPHFYKDDEKEQKRVDSVYKGYHLHDIINSFYVAFKGYHLIERYAKAQKVMIYNATRGSFIDAFARKQL